MRRRESKRTKRMVEVPRLRLKGCAAPEKHLQRCVSACMVEEKGKGSRVLLTFFSHWFGGIGKTTSRGSLQVTGHGSDKWTCVYAYVYICLSFHSCQPLFILVHKVSSHFLKSSENSSETWIEKVKNKNVKQKYKCHGVQRPCCAWVVVGEGGDVDNR